MAENNEALLASNKPDGRGTWGCSFLLTVLALVMIIASLNKDEDRIEQLEIDMKTMKEQLDRLTEKDDATRYTNEERQDASDNSKPPTPDHKSGEASVKEE